MIDEKYLEENKDKINWRTLIRNNGNKIDESLLEKYTDYVPWGLVARKCKNRLSKEFIERNLDKLNFTHVVRFCKVDSDFITRHEDLMDEECWSYVMKYVRIKNAYFIFDHKDKLNIVSGKYDFIVKFNKIFYCVDEEAVLNSIINKYIRNNNDIMYDEDLYLSYSKYNWETKSKDGVLIAKQSVPDIELLLYCKRNTINNDDYRDGAKAYKECAKNIDIDLHDKDINNVVIYIDTNTQIDDGRFWLRGFVNALSSDAVYNTNSHIKIVSTDNNGLGLIKIIKNIFVWW